MKRSAFLQPLSREHHTALSVAKSCIRAGQSGEAVLMEQACQRLLGNFAVELDRHFEVEERSLLPLLEGAEGAALVQRTLEDHQALRELIKDLRCTDGERLECFGKRLVDHVRFEERELFPALEHRV